MGPEGAANIIFSRDIANSDNPEKTRAEKIEEYREKFANPYVAASHGMVDDVIDPRETRIKLIQALDMMRNKKETRPKKKHGNIPLIRRWNLLNKERLLEEFFELVQIDSETKDEREIADVLKVKMEELGFTVIEDDSAAKKWTRCRESNCFY